MRYFKDRFPSVREEITEYLLVFVYISIPVVVWAIVVFLVLPSLLGRSWFRRWLLGGRYIEGYWFEWNQDQEQNGSGRLSVMTIQPNKGKEYFVISGEHHDEKGRMDKPFRCFPYSFSWPELKYVYTARQTSKFSEDVEGNGEFVFRAVDGAPQEFGGSYAYGRVGGSAVVRGRRLTPKEVAAYRRADLRDSLLRTVITNMAEGRPDLGSRCATANLIDCLISGEITATEERGVD
jgi:hypothetical protein